MLCRKLLIEQITHPLLCFLQLIVMHAIANCCFQCLIRWVAEASSTALIAIGKVATKQQEQRVLIDVERLKHLNILSVCFTQLHFTVQYAAIVTNIISPASV